MTAQLEAVRAEIEKSIDRESLIRLLPPGGARCAVDNALWDLEAKQSGVSAFVSAGIALPAPVQTAYTIGIRPTPDYTVAARAHAQHRVLKLKVNSDDPIGSVRAARAGAPDSVFIVDPNQAWTVDMLRKFAPALANEGVVLLEQPIAVGAESELDGYRCPIRLCADELIKDVADLAKARNRFDLVNIKLDKTGGLTTALRLADAIRAEGMGVMIGCMGGTSLAMAPAMVVAQTAEFVDLDGPLLLASDCPHGLGYHNGFVTPPEPILWG
jgi:L-alanine-DL-glutamate epimerase-like enolase superfamily enzyme